MRNHLLPIFWNVVRFFSRLDRHLFRGLLQGLSFLEAYFFTRSWPYLLGAIPALIVAAPFLVIVAQMPFTSRPQQAARYREAAIRAYESGDYDVGDLMQQKLEQLGVRDEIVQLQSALSERAASNMEQTLHRMQQIAPEDRPGLFHAHFWIAQAIVYNRLPFLEQQESQRLYDIHTKHADTLQPDHVGLRILKGRHLIKQGQADAAELLLRDVIAREIGDQVNLAQLQMGLRNVESAKRVATSGLRSLEKLRAEGTPWTVEHYLAAASLLEITVGRGEALEQLRASLAAFPQDAALRDRVVSYLLELARSIPQDGSDFPDILAELLRLAPQRDDVQEYFAVIPTAKRGADATQLLVRSRESGTLTASAARAWATQCLQQQELQEARTIYVYLCRIQADDHLAANNLAWLLAFEEPRDLPEAQRWANQACSLAPNQPRYRDTRGQIFAAQGQWSDAIADLTVAVNGMPTQPATHLALAKAYAAVGNQALADAYRQSAKQMRTEP